MTMVLLAEEFKPRPLIQALADRSVSLLIFLAAIRAAHPGRTRYLRVTASAVEGKRWKSLAEHGAHFLWYLPGKAVVVDANLTETPQPAELGG